jgi:hypothetical protein
MHALLNGQPGVALAFNPLAVVLAPGGVYLAIHWLVEPWNRSPTRAPELPPAIARMVPVVIIAFWLLRNLEPFAFLAPGGAL